MKIILVNASYTLEERYGKSLKAFGGNTEPLGLAYLAATVRQEGYYVEIVDAPVQNFTAEKIAEKVKLEDFDIVGFGMLTPMYGRVKETAAAVKKTEPKTTVVIGGAHATVLPEETLEEIKCDIVVIGEGENTFSELVYTL